MHLLVIEDERALCETIVRSLRRLAYSVDYCYDGEKALALLGVERYDLVLLDLNLPGKDGMVHISKMADHRIEKVEDAVKEGDMVWVKVMEIDLDRRRISLSMKSAAETLGVEIEVTPLPSEKKDEETDAE